MNADIVPLPTLPTSTCPDCPSCGGGGVTRVHGRACRCTKPCSKCGELDRYRSGLCRPCQKAQATQWQEDNFPRYLMLQARFRAKKCGVPFDLKESDIVIPETCPVFGFPLVRSRGGKGVSASSPSVDRIVPALGYVASNIVVISFKANAMKQDKSLDEMEQGATTDELKRLAEFYKNLAGRM